MKEKKILIVDDDEQILELLSEVLEEEGFITDSASDGEEALKKLEDASYHLVISDIRMPGIDGFEVLQQVKEKYKKTKVILMTGYTEEYDISDALILGADDYITKPFDDSKVILAVKNALKK